MGNILNSNYPLVSISCTTYNHKNYIRDAIEGFLKQKAKFQFEILLHDDASTDGTNEIIKEYEHKYPDLIFPVYQKENQYSKGVVISPTFNWPRARGKYIALCEGDDYWTDPYKLQKQVELLERRSDCSACFTNALVYNEIINTQRKFILNLKEGILSDRDIFMKGGGLYPTASLVFRREAINYDDYRNINELFGDEILIMALAMNNKIYFIDEITCVYRRWEGGVYSKNSMNKMYLVKHKKQIIIGLTKFMNFTDRPKKELIRNRISRESIYILKNDPSFKNLKYLKNVKISYLMKAFMKI